MSPKEIRVLLVDDEEELIEYLSKRLLREGFLVKAVTSGELALQAIEEQDYDVALVDLKMPGMDGIETQRQLKQKCPYLQTVVLTGHGTLQAALDSGREQAFRFLQKPADHEEMVNTIRDAAQKKDLDCRAMFKDEVMSITSSGSSPRDIVRGVEDLRKKYRLD